MSVWRAALALTQPCTRVWPLTLFRFSVGFRALDRRFGPAATLGQAATKAIAGHVTLFPTYTVGFFLAMGLLEGRGWDGAVQRLKDSFGTTMVSGSVFW